MARVAGVIGVPTLGMISVHWIQARLNLSIPLGMTWIDWFVLGKRIDEARNEIVEKALEVEADWVLFLDDDVIFPPFAFGQMFLRQRDIITAVYWSKSNPPYPVIFRDYMRGPFLNWHVGDFMEVDAAGCGCTLIRTRVFKKIKPPWFSLNYTVFPKEERTGPDVGTTEDLYFYHKARRAGFKIFADCGIQCLHFDKNSGMFFGMPPNSPQANPEWKRVLKTSKRVMLDIGCGASSPHFEGKVIRLDIREEVKPDIVADARKIPLEDCSVDVVYSSHTLEHFSHRALRPLLREWLRVLRVGGELRLIVPNLEYAAKRILEDKIDDYTMFVLYGQQEYKQNFHASGFTPKTLERFLEGFEELEEIEVTTSQNQAEIFAQAKKTRHITFESIYPEEWLEKDGPSPQSTEGGSISKCSDGRRKPKTEES